MSFSTNYDATIRDLESKLGDLIDSGEDFDLDRRGDVLTIEFENGEKIVITPQAPTEQLWVSSDYSGHRFNWDEGWVNEKGGERFGSFLQKAITKQMGHSIDLG